MKTKEFKGTKGPWSYTIQEKIGVISIHTGDSPYEVDRGNNVWDDPNVCGIWFADLEKSRHGFL